MRSWSTPSEEERTFFGLLIGPDKLRLRKHVPLQSMQQLGFK
jgi:hypothetical protein